MTAQIGKALSQDQVGPVDEIDVLSCGAAGEVCIPDFDAVFEAIAGTFGMTAELEDYNLQSRPGDSPSRPKRSTSASVSILVGCISYPGAAVHSDIAASFALACANALKRASLDALSAPPGAFLRDN
jgi:hypothetical protein